MSDTGATPKISARAHSDDRAIEISFNAYPWFAQAVDAEILALADKGWGGCDPADEVAQFMETQDSEVDRLFTFLSTHPRMSNGDTVGFECYVEEDETVSWIKEN